METQNDLTTFLTSNSLYVYRVTGEHKDAWVHGPQLELQCLRGTKQGQTYSGVAYLGLPEVGKRFVLYLGGDNDLCTSHVAEVRPYDSETDGPTLS